MSSHPTSSCADADQALFTKTLNYLPQTIGIAGNSRDFRFPCNAWLIV